MSLIPEDKIAEVRERTDLVEVVSRHVTLRRAGQSFKACCPFHQEKTPSFVVHPPPKSFFYCFGCHEKGDVISFIMKVEARTFMDVVRDLAQRAGVELPDRDLDPAQERAARQARDERERLLAANDVATRFYRGLLLGSPLGEPGRAYLERRGVTAEVAERFRLGYAPAPEGEAGWDLLARHLAEQKILASDAERADLIVPRRSGRGHYDRFRGRLLCPVMGLSGEVLGFSGRLVVAPVAADADAPKYLNTRETPVFKKGEGLFGIHAARTAMRRAGRALLVEGNFDVISLHGAGLDEAVAPLGTALTERQVEVLRRQVPQVVLCLDGDRAGREATLKAARLLLTADLPARVAALPDGQDPDTMVREPQGAARLRALIERAPSSIEHVIETVAARAGASIPERARAVEELAPLLREVRSPTERDLYVGHLASRLEVRPELVQRAVRVGGPVAAAPRAPAAALATSPAAPVGPAERALLELLVALPRLIPRAVEAGAADLLGNDAARAAFDALALAGPALRPEALPDALPADLQRALMEAVVSERFAALEEPERALAEALASLRVGGSLDRELSAARRELAAAQRAGDDDRARELGLLVHRLSQERARLRSGADPSHPPPIA